MMMVLFIYSFLLFLLLFIIFIIILKNIKKAIIFSIAVQFIILLTISLILLEDTLDLKNIQTEDNLFLLSNGIEFTSGLVINPSSTEPQILNKNELDVNLYLFQNSKKDIKNKYFKTIIFNRDSFQETLSEEPINIPGIDTSEFTKVKILEGIYSKDKTFRDQTFALAILNILSNLDDTENLAIFIKSIKKGDIEVYPKIKIMNFISLLPEESLNRIISATRTEYF